ncbi:MAG: HNH endonuclease, partial [Proteobacteria bacterium]
QSNQHRGQQTEMDLETLFLNGQLEKTLSRLTDDELLFSTESAVETERRQGLIVVKHFNEIYKRQLFLARGYPSMFEMLRQRYLYCAGSAQLRISSMKLMNEVPGVEAKLETGELSMSAAAQLQTFFRAEKKIQKTYSAKEKLAFVEKCEGKSTREVERELASVNPSILKTEFVKPVSATRSKITLTVSNELIEKLNRLRDLHSHAGQAGGELSYEDLISKLADLALEKPDRQQAKKKSVASPAVHAHESGEKKSRYITASVRAEVLSRNANQGCSFIDSKTGRRCGSHRFLQIDHVIPFSRGGSNDAENLRVLCGAHNRLAWSTIRRSK